MDSKIARKSFNLNRENRILSRFLFGGLIAKPCANFQSCVLILLVRAVGKYAYLRLALHLELRTSSDQATR